MGPTVILRHELPDGTHHFDWLIARSYEPGGPDDRVLVSFRMDRRPDEAAREKVGDLAGGEVERGRGLEATRLPAHRVEYLTYEGPIAGGRGRASRVAHGRARILTDAADEFVVEAEFAGGPQRLWRAERPNPANEPDRWVFAPDP